MSDLVRNPEDRFLRDTIHMINMQPDTKYSNFVSDELLLPYLAGKSQRQSGTYHSWHLYLSHLVGKPTMWFPNRSDTNRAVQAQKRARSLKFWS